MSITFLRTLCARQSALLRNCECTKKGLLNKLTFVATYARRSDSELLDTSFKVVKSKARVEDTRDLLGFECGPNWELLRPRNNRFYFPNGVGPAWQGISTTLQLNEPLESLVDFDNERKNRTKLRFSVGVCPNLMKKTLHELFPSPEVVSAEKLSLITLKFKGEPETGASKFVLAAREITSRLRLHGYWADFMNPFSGKPFYSWSDRKNLYKIDDRFRGLNMKVMKLNDCFVISKEHDENIFSGIIYSNAPSDNTEIRTLLNDMI